MPLCCLDLWRALMSWHDAGHAKCKRGPQSCRRIDTAYTALATIQDDARCPVCCCNCTLLAAHAWLWQVPAPDAQACCLKGLAQACGGHAKDSRHHAAVSCINQARQAGSVDSPKKSQNKTHRRTNTNNKFTLGAPRARRNLASAMRKRSASESAV